MITRPRDHGRASYQTAVAALAGAQKLPRGVPLYTLRVNRPLGRRLAAVAHVLGVQPNAVTALSGVCSLLAVALIALVEPSLSVGVAVGILLLFGYMLDSADGQLARLSGGGSRSGEWLDHMVDAAVKLLLHLAVLVAWFRLDVAPALLLAAVAYLLVSVLTFFGGTLAGVLREHLAAPGSGRDPGGAPSWALLPVDHGVISLVFLTWGWQSGFTTVYLTLLVLNAVLLAAYLRHWFRRLS